MYWTLCNILDKVLTRPPFYFFLRGKWFVLLLFVQELEEFALGLVMEIAQRLVKQRNLIQTLAQ